MNQQVRSRAVSWRWIIDAREDLIWFIGSVVSSYLLLVLYVAGIVPLIPMVAAWAILIDAPHVFGTLSRTYFDASEWNTRRRLMLGSLLFFVVVRLDRQQVRAHRHLLLLQRRLLIRAFHRQQARRH